MLLWDNYERFSTGSDMTERILVVDDDPDILQFVQMNLEMDGFEVDLAGGGREALEKAAASPPDLMLLDVMMPEIDGLTVLRRMRSDPPTANIPVIVLTARSLAEDRVKGLDLGADQPDMNGTAAGFFNGSAPDIGAEETSCP